MKKEVPIIVCDICEKSQRHDRAKGKWLHIQFSSIFGVKTNKKPTPVDLCSSTCAKKWAAGHPAFNQPKPEPVESTDGTV